MSDRFDVLRLLADGEFHSGESLAGELGVSRTAVWKHVRALEPYGVEVRAVPGRGYRLGRAIELLSAARIRERLNPAAGRCLGALDVLTETDSTNQRLLESAPGDPRTPGRACLAEYQRAGRGRHGNRWVAPLGAGLCLSLLWRFAAPPSSLMGLSLAAGVVLARGLEAHGVGGCGLKWPNDLIWDGRKLAGILVEVRGEADGPCSVVIGLGVNVALPAAALGQIDQPCTDVVSIVGHPVSRNGLAATLLNGLCTMLPGCEEQLGLGPFLEAWRDYDVLSGQRVEVRQAHGQRTEGVAQTVDADGALLVSTAEGPRRFLSGEVSVRPVP